MRYALFLGGFEQGKQMGDVRVNTTVGDETEEVETAVGLFGALEGGEDIGVGVELTLLDRDVDAHDVLPDNAAGADIQMSDMLVR